MTDYSFTSADKKVQENTSELLGLLETIQNALTPSGAERKAQELIEKICQEAAGFDMGARGQQGFTLLMDLLLTPGLERPANLLPAMIDAGADIHTRNMYETSALMTAVSNGRLPEIQTLIEAGADVDHRSPDGWNPVWAAVVRDEDANLMNLLDAGVSVHLPDIDDDECSVKDGVFETENITSMYLAKYKERWVQNLERFEKGTYTPACRQDWNHLASVLPVADPQNPPSIADRLQMLRDMRPEIGLGKIRAQAVRAEGKAEGI